MNSKIKEFFSNAILFTIANMGSKIMVFLMIPLYTSVLTTEEYAISDMVQTTATMLISILTVKIADAVLRFCFLKQYSTKDVFSIGIRTILLGVFICLFLSFLFLFVPLFSELGFYVLFIPFLFLSESLSDLFHKYCRGIDKVKVSVTAGLLTTLVMILSNLLFLLVIKIGVLGYLLSFILGNGVAIVYMVFKSKASDSYSSNKDSILWKEMVKYSLPLVPNSLSWWALSSINRYVMLVWLGTSAVGIYSATLRVPSILTVLCDIFAQAWLLSALKNYDSEDTKMFIRSVHNKYFSLFVVMTGGIILLAYPLSKILLSGEFTQYWWLTPYLFISVFFGAIVGFLGSIFSSERKNIMQFVSTLVGAVVSFLITVLFLKHHGVVVVAIASMVGYYIIWLIRRLAVNEYLNIGYSTLFSTLQGLILVVEAFLVGKQMYLWALACVLILIVLNFRELMKIGRFGFSSVGNIVRSKKK